MDTAECFNVCLRNGCRAFRFLSFSGKALLLSALFVGLNNLKSRESRWLVTVNIQYQCGECFGLKKGPKLRFVLLYWELFA